MPLLCAADPAAVHLAARHLAEGALVAFPTETVYGLGARADDDAAVAGIFRAKGRPADHPLIVHVADVAAAAAFAERLPPMAQALVERFWPGPLTVIVARRAGVAVAAAGGQPTVGLRCPDHPAALALLREAAALGVPGIAGPSANRFGRVSPTRAAHVVDEFGPDLPVLDGGPCREGIESTIVDCTREQPFLLRPGTLPRAALEAVIGGALRGRDELSPRAPGSLASHYAPAARLRLMSSGALEQALHAAAGTPGGEAVGVYSVVAPRAVPGVAFRRMPGDPAAVAHELFEVLRRFDAEGMRQIWVQEPPETPEWEGVRDRLRRAAAV